MVTSFGTETEPLYLRPNGPIYKEDASIIRTNLQTLINQGHINFVIDLSSVDYIDCSGLGVLVEAKKKVSSSGGYLVVTGISGIVELMFHLTKLRDYLCCNQQPCENP